MSNLVSELLTIDGLKQPDRSLPTYLSRRSSELMEQLVTHGAVLFRNFAVQSERDFEQAILSIEGMRPMSGYLMSEPGRKIVDGARYVFNTNELHKTGGSWLFKGVHTENYHSADVPRYICFFCMKSSWLGGETGLYDMTRVYRDLEDGLRARLEKTAYCVSHYSVRDLAERYDVSADVVRTMCRTYGLSTFRSSQGEERIVVYKPSIFDHPVTKEPALTANVCNEVPGLRLDLQTVFMRTYYSGWRWALHRWCWRHPALVEFLAQENKLALLRKWLRTRNSQRPAVQSPDEAATALFARVANAVSRRDCQLVAESMRKHFRPCKWQVGDVLVVDNMQTAHNGMPGLGPRLLRVMLLNPVKLDLSIPARGRQAPRDSPSHIGLAQFLSSSRGATPASGDLLSARR